MFLYPGFKLNKYEIKEPVGKPGGFGMVYRAVEDITGKEVAVKQFFEKGNLAEFQVLAKLNHPNIIQYITYEVYNDTHYMIMEYAPGGNLLEIMINQQRLPEDQILEILRQVAGALDFAHRQGIVHRDIKPENIMCCSNNTYKLADFGIARLLDSGKSMSRTKGANSIFYAAPELFNGKFGKKTDIYALGAMLFLLLTGTPPFTGSTDQEIYQKIMDEKLKPEIPLNISQVSRNILANCLEKNVGERWGIEQVLRELVGADRNAADIGMLHSHVTVGRTSQQETSVLVADSSGDGDNNIQSQAITEFASACQEKSEPRFLKEEQDNYFDSYSVKDKSSNGNSHSFSLASGDKDKKWVIGFGTGLALLLAAAVGVGIHDNGGSDRGHKAVFENVVPTDNEGKNTVQDSHSEQQINPQEFAGAQAEKEVKQDKDKKVGSTVAPPDSNLKRKTEEASTITSNDNADNGKQVPTITSNDNTDNGKQVQGQSSGGVLFGQPRLPFLTSRLSDIDNRIALLEKNLNDIIKENAGNVNSAEDNNELQMINQIELEINNLKSQRSSIKTEIEAVKIVIDKNIESSFKAFE